MDERPCPDAEPCDEPKAHPAFGSSHPTRRGVLAGSGALIIAGRVQAAEQPTEHLQLEFADDSHRQILNLRNLSAVGDRDPIVLSWDRRDFGPLAWFSIHRESQQHPPELNEARNGNAPVARTWLPTQLRVTVHRASFPGLEKSTFDVVVTFSRRTPTDTWKVSARLSPGWFPDAPATSAAELPLADFLNAANPKKLRFMLQRRDNSRMLRGFFGDRIETYAELALEFDRQAYWTILSLADATAPGLYILDFPLEFGRLDMYRIRGDAPASATAAPSPTGGKTAGSGTAGTGNVGPNVLRLDAEIRWGAPPPRGPKDPVVDGCYAVAGDILGFTTQDPARGARVPGAHVELAATTVAGERLAAVLTLDLKAIGVGKGSERHTLGAVLRHWGIPAHTAACCFVDPNADGHSIAYLELRRGAGGAPSGIEGPFSVAGIEIVRQLRRGRGVVTRVVLTPAAKEVLAETSLGGLVLAALPRSSPAPGRGPRVAPLEIEAVDATDDSERRILTRFEARMALFSACVALPESVKSAACPDHPNGVVPGTHSWRLDFDHADALLYVPGLSDAPITSADAVVPLGPAPTGSPAAGNEPGRQPHAQISLDRACLTVLRPADLLALKFRFAGLALDIPWPPKPELPATLAPHGGRSAARPFPEANGRRAISRDERPILVVEFPPQHVAERAYPRRLPAPIDLPVLTVSDSDAKRFHALREALAGPKQWSLTGTNPLQACREKPEQGGFRAIADKILSRLRSPTCGAIGTDISERVALRQAMRDLAKASFEQPLFGKTVAEFDQQFTAEAQRIPRRDGGTASLPDDQQLYVGADFLDPDARQIAIRVLRAMQQAAGATPGSGPDTSLPDANLDPSEREAILQGFIDRRAVPDVADTKTLLARLENTDVDAQKQDFQNLKELIGEVELAKERRDVTYAEFRRRYARLATSLPEPFRQYRGREWFGKWPDQEPFRSVGKTIRAEAARTDEDEREPFDAVTPARLSGPSRIAFRIDTEDFEADRTGGRIPFTVEGLTNWGGMDMAVVRRAECLMEPLAPGRTPRRWERRASTDEGAILRFQGFSSDRRWGGVGPRRQWAPAAAGPSPAQRLAEIHASSAEPPDVFETALELPYRLFLSPSQDATWKTSAARVAREAFGSCETGKRDWEIETFRELWTARLAETGERAGLRAVWSPDFRPDAFLSTHAPGAPERGPILPWALPRSAGIRNPGDVPGQTFRTGLDAYDRHELVSLTALHGLPVLGRRAAQGGTLTAEAGQIEPPEGFALPGLQTRDIEALGGKVELSAIYRPKALSVSELSLSALGGCLDVDTAFQPPASARDAGGSNLFDALSVERWRQRTVLGRDVLVEVVYKGFLFPVGHRACLVKLTERRFVQTHAGGPPMAVLIQRLFLRVGNPVKTFPAEGQPNRGRRWPCERVTILTRQTPDLVDADSYPEGVIRLGPGTTGRCFWPRTALRKGAEVWFQMRIGDEGAPVRLPLIFVDNTAANDQKTMEALVKHYNGTVSDGLRDSPTRKLERNGQPVVMAPEYKPGDTSYQTRWWRLAAEGRERTPPKGAAAEPRTFDNTLFERDEFMEGLDQPAFYPVVESASCRIGPVERLTGQSPLWAEVAFEGAYVADGFGDDPDISAGSTANREAQPEIYLRIVGNQQNGSNALPLRFGNRGDQGGGVARGEMEIVGISRHLGPINGGNANSDKKADSATPAVNDAQPSLPRSFNPSDIFPANAKLLGIASLRDLVKVATEAADKLGHHPKLAEALEYGAASVKEGAADLRAVLTDALIKPAEAALIAAEAAWKEVASKRLDGNLPTLGEAYPQIGQDLGTLNLKLVESQDANSSDVAFFAALAPIHEAARRLIRTIERIAADPLAAASGAQVDLFRTIASAVADLKKHVETLGQIKSWPKRITDQLEIRLFATIHERLVRFADPSLPAADAASAAQIVGEVVRKTRPSAFTLDEISKMPGRLALQLRTAQETAAPPLSDALSQALINLSGRLMRLQDDIDVAVSEAEGARELASRLAAGAAEETRRLLEEAAAQAASRLEAAEDAASAVLLSPPVARIVRIISRSQAVWAAFETGPATPKAVAEAVGTVVPSLLDILDELGAARGIEQQAAAWCGAVTDALRAGLDVVLPSASLPEVPSACRDALAKGQFPSACPNAGPVTTLFELGEDLRKRVGPLGLAKKFEDLQRSLVDAMDGLAGLAEQRRLLTSALPATGGAGACVLPQPDVSLPLRGIELQQARMLNALRRVAADAGTLAEQLILETADQARLEVLQGALRLAAQALDQAQSVTLLGQPGAALQALSGRIRAVAALVPQGSGTKAALNRLADEAASGQARLTERSRTLAASANTLRELANRAATLTSTGLTDAIAAAERDAERQILLAGGEILARSQALLAGALHDLIDTAATPVAGLFTAATDLLTKGDGLLAVLAAPYNELIKARDGLTGQIAKQTNPIVLKLLNAAGRGIGNGQGTEPKNFFRINPRVKDGKETDDLDAERDLIQSARDNLAGGRVEDALRNLRTLGETYRTKPSLNALVDRFARIDTTFLRTVVVEALDLRALQGELEKLVRDLVPTRATLSYDLSAELDKFPKGQEIFDPASGTRLDIAARTIVDLRTPDKAPDVRVDGKVGPFKIKLLGNFEAVTLHFRGLTFQSGGGRSSSFDVRFDRVEIGEKAQFLKQLESYLTPKGGRPPIRPLTDKPGIEASYGINLGSFGVGTLSFSNVTLNAGARLPFTNDEAVFVVSIGRPDAPFLISSTIFGGGGYLALLANPEGFIGLEASFDYGGVFAFGFGPLTGSGQITLGVYFRSARKAQPDLGVNFIARGAANIACFGFSTSLFVRLKRNDTNGNMEGLATYTFGFSLGFDDIEFKVDVYVNQGASMGKGGSPADQATLLDMPDFLRTEYAALGGSKKAKPPAKPPPKPSEKPAPVAAQEPELRVVGPTQEADWFGYRSLFDRSLDPVYRI